ncbi:MAG: sugar transporter [Bacteroides sp.]|nr:sugar transporter [Bacteroides sp.]MDD6149926.1 sugar transporter [Bacteroides sp.]MDY2973562.1 sugar transporter [Candidatus Cryptobacteroides sp.]
MMDNIKKWLPVISLTLSTFIFNTSEFIPIGLLTSIADDFAITESKAGLLITIYAWVVALASLPLMMAFAKTENKKLMLSLVALFTASHILSGFSNSYVMLMISRIGVACSHAVFWSIVTPLAVHVAPEGHRSTALSMIITGSSIAMIVGLPLGRAVGLMVGWRVTFLLIAILSAIVLCLLAAFLPKVPSDNNISLKTLPTLVSTPALLCIFVMTALTITGHFTAYSYIEPFLGQAAGFTNGEITMVLSAFGVIGIIVSVLFSKYYDRHQFAFLRVAVLGICICTLLLGISSGNSFIMVCTCLLWGLSINCFNISLQSCIIDYSPFGTAIAMSIYSGIYNVGIGAGALVGGIVCSHIGIPFVGYVGGAVSLVSALFFLLTVTPVLKKSK